MIPTPPPSPSSDREGDRPPRPGLSVLSIALAALVCGSGACKDDAPINGGFGDAGIADVGVSECGATEVGVWQETDLGLGTDEELEEVNLFGVWGVETEDSLSVWAAGSGGKVLRFDGDQWGVLQTPADVQLTSIWGTSPTNVWVAGFEGVVLQYDGAQWLDRSPPIEMFLRNDAGVATDPDASAAKRANLWGIWVAGRDDQTDAVFVVGDRGTVLLWQTDAWETVETGGVEEDLSAVWGANAANVFAVGDFGTALKGSASGFTRQDTRIARALRGVWGRGASDVYAVGVEGTILRFDGSAWQQVDGAPRQVLRDIWGPSNDRSTTYIVGWDGALIRMGGGPTFRRGATFDVIGCVTKHRLEGIWGTLVDDPALAPDDPEADAGVADGGPPPQIPAVWAVGVSGRVITGP